MEGVIIPESFSFPFTPITIRGHTVIRPYVPTKIRYKNRSFNTHLLVDSGADYSMLRKEVAEFLGIDLSKLKRTGLTSGIGGKPVPTSYVVCEIEINYRNRNINEDIPFQIILDDKSDPEINILGRIPFFYDHRVDFRMGFTDSKTLGKFVIYKEEKKRKASKFMEPLSFVKE